MADREYLQTQQVYPRASLRNVATTNATFLILVTVFPLQNYVKKGKAGQSLLLAGSPKYRHHCNTDIRFETVTERHFVRLSCIIGDAV